MYKPDARDVNEGAARLRVLVVDDAPDVTELLALMMSHAGARRTPPCVCKSVDSRQ